MQFFKCKIDQEREFTLCQAEQRSGEAGIASYLFSWVISHRCTNNDGITFEQNEQSSK